MCQIEFKFNKKKYLWLQGFNEHTPCIHVGES